MPSKYRNKKTEVDGIVFDSKAEANRYQELKLLERAGVITHLQLQPEYKCIIDSKLVCKYRADFRYIDHERQCTVVEDVKGYKTDVYRLKKKLVEALYPGTVIEEISK